MIESSQIAAALSRIREITKENGGNIVRSNQMLRPDRELLTRMKWLQEIIKGWYILVRPEALPGDSSAWYANFWDFLRIYLRYHYGDLYSLSAENSLDLHTGASSIPRQVIVISTKGSGAPQELPYDTSVFIYSAPSSIPEERGVIHGLQVMSLPYALCKVTSAYFHKNPRDAEIALRLIRNPSELIGVFLKYNFKSAAERLIGAYRFIGSKEIAEELQENLTSVGWNLKEENPFVAFTPTLAVGTNLSPYSARILSLWNNYREKVIQYFPSPPNPPRSPEKYLADLEDLYDKDAYNSLSIEGYRVDEDLIARVHSNEWNPDSDSQDDQERNALAARGYYEAFVEVKKSLTTLLQGENRGSVIEKDLKKWYQSLFSPLARVGILRNEDLFGYRKSQVYIRNSRHVPLPKEALIDAMETLFKCLKKEENAAVAAVLGHYFFVYIHPYMDGNGRLGRFIMNAMFASGSYPWTIIQVKNRSQYINALEMAGSEKNIEPFAQFIAKEMGLFKQE